jgi:hypothetical protein
MYTRKKEQRRYVKWINLEEDEEYKVRYLLRIPTATQRPYPSNSFKSSRAALSISISKYSFGFGTLYLLPLGNIFLT